MARTSTNASDASFHFGTTNVLSGATQAFWSLWIKLTAWDASFQTFWSKDDYPTMAGGWGFQRQSTNNQFTYFERGSSNSSGFTSGITGPPFGWTHFAVHRDSGAVARLWINGSFVGNTSLTARKSFVPAQSGGKSASSGCEIQTWHLLHLSMVFHPYMPWWLRGTQSWRPLAGLRKRYIRYLVSPMADREAMAARRK